MKDSEFLELLNLYLDHEITPADAARLEAEVRADPERRRTYLQYCRMQKACAKRPVSADDIERAATQQVKLAAEQARYEIAFRQDLAELAELIRRQRNG